MRLSCKNLGTVENLGETKASQNVHFHFFVAQNSQVFFTKEFPRRDVYDHKTKSMPLVMVVKVVMVPMAVVVRG